MPTLIADSFLTFSVKIIVPEVPTVFLSYAWANSAEADEIDNHFESVGIQFRRDIRDLEFKSPIKEFMQQVGKSDYVVMLISDDFLNSPNCMYEVLELMRDREFDKRLLQVILPGVKIFDPKYRVDLIRKWNARVEELTARIQDLPLGAVGPIANEIKHYGEICSNIAFFTQSLVDQNSISYADLKANNYKLLLRFMGIDEDLLVSRLLEIQEIPNKKEAIREADRFTRKYPSYARGFFTLGFFQDDPADRIYYYDLAIDIDPELAIAYYNRGVNKHYLGDTKGAIADYDKSIELNPNHLSSYINRGADKRTLADYEGAIADYDVAIKLNPTHASTYNNRGNSKAHLYDYEGAIADYDKAIELAPEYVRAYFNRGIAKADLSEHENAIADYNKAIKLDPNNIRAYGIRGLSKSAMKDEKGAIADFSKVIELDPNNGQAYESRGNSKDNLGDEKGAKEDWDKAAALDQGLKALEEPRKPDYSRPDS